MTLALNEHPWLKFHHRKSGATYSLKSDFLQPVFFIQAVSAASGRTESKSSALLLVGRGWAGAILFNGKGNQINPVQTQSLPSEEGWEVSGELLYIATFCCIYFPAAQSEDSKANPLCNEHVNRENILKMVGTSISMVRVCITQLCFSQEQGCLSRVVCWCLFSWSLRATDIKLRFRWWGWFKLSVGHHTGATGLGQSSYPLALFQRVKMGGFSPKTFLTISVGKERLLVSLKVRNSVDYRKKWSIAIFIN